MRRPLLWLLLAVAGVVADSGEVMVHGQKQEGSATVTFTAITRDAGIDFTHTNGASAEKHLVETMGSGGLFLDYDRDGWIDMFLVDGGSPTDASVMRTARHRLYRNRRDGTFDDVTPQSGIAQVHVGMGACAGDYDNDGWVDLYITNFGPNVLYRNTGTGVFHDVTRTARVGSPLWSASCAFADLDRDGDLDLFVTSYVAADATDTPFCGNARLKTRFYCHPLNFDPLPNVVYRNDGGGVFTDVSSTSGIGSLRGNGLGVAIADYDNDGWPDVFVANDGVPNFLFHRTSPWRFTDLALRDGVAVATDGLPRAGMGADAGDYDGDLRIDFVLTAFAHDRNTVYRNVDGQHFDDATEPAGLAAAT